MAGDIEAIAAMPDPVVRNLRITLSYHRLSAALAARTRPCVNWCTFAAWASKQAGRTIRGEDVEDTVARAVTDVLDGPPAAAVVAALRALGSTPDVAAVRRTLREAIGIEPAFARASAAVARGNLKVFEEIAAVFAAFVATRLADPAPDAAAIEAFVATLRPGDPPVGQDGLRSAFRHFYGALFEPDPKARAERVLLANLYVGLHEQRRLQPEIAAALDAPVADPGEVVERLLDAHLPGAWLLRVRRRVSRLLGIESPLDRAVAGLVARVRALVRAALTGRVMVLELPNGVVLRLGRDLPGPFPAALTTIANPELRDLFGTVVSTPDGTGGSGAVDWADFGERMHFIAVLFRRYADHGDLFAPPFTADQVAALDAGRLPAGRL